MPLPEPIRAFWYRWEEAAQWTRQTPWGVVVADPRYPLIYDANHAAVLEDRPGLTLDDIREALHPALDRAGAPHEHIEFWAGHTTPAAGRLRARVGRAWYDAVMVFGGAATAAPADVKVREVTEPDDRFLAWYRDSRWDFGERTELSQEVVDQLFRRHLEVYRPMGLRWFVGLVGGRPAGLAALVSLEGVGYVDSVVTMPEYRRRGVATATVSRAIEESLDSGDRVLHLLAAEGEEPHRLYERLGFRQQARVVTFNQPREPGGT